MYDVVVDDIGIVENYRRDRDCPSNLTKAAVTRQFGSCLQRIKSAPSPAESARALASVDVDAYRTLSSDTG
jgi:hypothetical protein